MENKIFTVSAINNYVKQVIENDVNLFNIAVEGEISNLTIHSTGHIYFTIKDSLSVLKAVMFAFSAKKLTFQLKEGIKIIAIGSIKIYEPQGTYSLQVVNIKLDGIGELYLKYEALKQQLQAQGYFDQSIKKPLPQFPKNIAVVTAPTGAAIRDIITTIERRYPLANVYLFPTLVQGKGASEDISKKIYRVKNFTIPIDVLIVGRGGGSMEDLWAFNELPTVKAIYESTIPIISAVGHEIDYTLADFTADVRAATPTAASELATPSREELLNFLKQQYRNLVGIIKTKIDRLISQFNNYKNNYHLNNISWIYQDKMQKYQNILTKFTNIYDTFFSKQEYNLLKSQDKMIFLMQNRLSTIANKQKQMIAKLDLLSPLKTLARGYSLASLNGKTVVSTKQVKVNDQLTVILVDGILHSKITDIKSGN